MLKVAYLGPAGTFTELAARQLGKDAELVPVASVTEAMDQVVAGLVDRAVVPIENSIEGGVSATSDALAQMAGVQIYGEYLVPVKFDLMVRPGTKLSEIKEVLTHPVAYAQSRKWLEANLPGHTHIPAASTASAVKFPIAASPALCTCGEPPCGNIPFTLPILTSSLAFS